MEHPYENRSKKTQTLTWFSGFAPTEYQAEHISADNVEHTSSDKNEDEKPDPRYQCGPNRASVILHALVENHAVNDAAQRAGINPSLTYQRGKGSVKVREEGRCRMCLRPNTVRPIDGYELVEDSDARRLTRHHLVPERYFRKREEIKPLRNCDPNCIPLCRPCHDLIERGDEFGRIARSELRRSLGSVEIAFAIQVRGRVWFDQKYPRFASASSEQLATLATIAPEVFGASITTSPS